MGWKRKVSAVALAAALLVAGFMPAADARGRDGAGAGSCAPPGERWIMADAQEVDLDPDAIEAALDFAMTRATESVAVYRRGCLVARRDLVEGAGHESWSVAKSVTALAVGRAEHLGLLSRSDAVGKWFPRRSEALPHAEVTVEDLEHDELVETYTD